MRHTASHEPTLHMSVIVICGTMLLPRPYGTDYSPCDELMIVHYSYIQPGSLSGGPRNSGCVGVTP